jgi:hypothetical protein
MYEGKLVRLRAKREEDAEMLSRGSATWKPRDCGRRRALPPVRDEALQRVKAHAEGEFAVRRWTGGSWGTAAVTM